MDHARSTTTEHQKGKHLSCAERILIQLRLKDNRSANKIAKEIGCRALICSSVCSERYSKSRLRCRVRYFAIRYASNLQSIRKLLYRAMIPLSICELVAN